MTSIFGAAGAAGLAETGVGSPEPFDRLVTAGARGFRDLP
ncbi:hypothetical protein J2853_005370 [Streptosporangium lutulentum]|uniref:Uncharacterized protein n=1 Tax=Streptosporangium lutulentum TaxID=1461250 RepID=A0ABT9QJP3_9ACTN|nr:hypothetical protein [Streptosporangium lutulentum]